MTYVNPSYIEYVLNKFTGKKDAIYFAPETDPIFTAWFLGGGPLPIGSETDPIFNAWLIATPPLYAEVDPVFITRLATTPPLYAEVDPIFSAWLSTPPNISIFNNDAGYITSRGPELDPVFSAWLIATPPLYAETDPLSIHLDQTAPQTFIGGAVTGTGLLNVTAGVLGLDTTTYLTASTGRLLNGNNIGIKKTMGSIDNFDIGFITNNTERLTILTDGKVGIGTIIPNTTLCVGLPVYADFAGDIISNTSNGSSAIVQCTFNDDPVYFPGWFSMRSRGTNALPLSVVNGDQLGTFQFDAYNALARRNVARIKVIVDGIPGAANVPTYMSFACASSAAGPYEMLRLTSKYAVIGGGIASTSTRAGSLQVYPHPTNLTKAMNFKQTGLAHGMTSWADTNTWGQIETRDTTADGGGMFIQGTTGSDAAVPPLFLIGISGAGTPTTPCIHFMANKANGITVQNLAATDPAFAWINGSIELARMLGNGYLGIGTATPGALLHINAIAGTNAAIVLSDADNTNNFAITSTTPGAFAGIGSRSSNTGGYTSYGYCNSASHPALAFFGLNNLTTAITSAPVTFVSGKRAGTASTPVLAAEPAMDFYNTTVNTYSLGVLLMRIIGDGKVGLGGCTAPTTDIMFGKAADRTIQVEAQTTGVIGSSLTIKAGDTIAGPTRKGGDLNLYAGMGAYSGYNAINFYTPNVAGSGFLQTAVQRAYIDNIGNFGMPGITTITMNGNTVNTIFGGQRTTSSYGGLALTLQAGGAVVGRADLPGGDLYLYSGQSTGNQSSNIRFGTPIKGVSSTSARNPAERMILTGDGYLGIGIMPTVNLHVSKSVAAGNVAIYNINTDTTGGAVILIGEADSAGAYGYFGRAGSTFATSTNIYEIPKTFFLMAGVQAGSSLGFCAAATDGYIRFLTGGSLVASNERARINDAGGFIMVGGNIYMLSTGTSVNYRKISLVDGAIVLTDTGAATIPTTA